MTRHSAARREEVVRYGQAMLDEGLVIGTAGNVSARIVDEIVITPTGIPYHLIQPSDLCVLDLGGRQLAGPWRPSSETPFHTRIYETTEAAAIVHTHSPFATTLACVLDELPPIHYSIHRFGGDTVPVAEYERFGSEALADRVAEALRDRRGVLLRNHGTITYGYSVAEAFDLAVLLEWLAKLYWQAHQLGEPRLLSRGDVAEVAAEARRRRYEGTVVSDG